MDLSGSVVSAQRRLRRHPRLWGLMARSGVALGLSLENLRMLETMSRPWWLYRAGGRVPAGRVERRPPRAVAERDIDLCERLIAAFTAAASENEIDGERSGIWGWILDTHQRRLAEALDRGYARELASLLGSMFQQEFVWGITSDHGIRHHEKALGLRVLSLNSLDMLVSLAEAVGVVPVENPAQGKTGVAFDGGIAKLMDKLDRALGFEVDFPDVGAPYGLTVDGRLITLDTPEQIYAALRLDLARRNHLLGRPEGSTRVVEIGGGYGGTCYWFLRVCPDIARYTILDLPIMNVLQGYFLAQAHGASVVSFYGEEPAQVRILPASALAQVDTPFDMLVNKDGMPEMPPDAVTSYLQWARVSCDGLFYSCNQEAKAEFPLVGGTQGVVHEAIARVGGFDRVRRDRSWLRRGYVEEIYTSGRAGGMLPSA
jgi:hypothetical protein